MTPPPSTCRCGFAVGHHEIQPEPQYSLWGWVLLGLGATARPSLVRLRCTRCGVVLGQSRDPELLRRVG